MDKMTSVLVRNFGVGNFSVCCPALIQSKTCTAEKSQQWHQFCRLEECEWANSFTCYAVGNSLNWNRCAEAGGCLTHLGQWALRSTGGNHWVRRQTGGVLFSLFFIRPKCHPGWVPLFTHLKTRCLQLFLFRNLYVPSQDNAWFWRNILQQNIFYGFLFWILFMLWLLIYCQDFWTIIPKIFWWFSTVSILTS